MSTIQAPAALSKIVNMRNRINLDAIQVSDRIDQCEPETRACTILHAAYDMYHSIDDALLNIDVAVDVDAATNEMCESTYSACLLLEQVARRILQSL